VLGEPYGLNASEDLQQTSEIMLLAQANFGVDRSTTSPATSRVRTSVVDTRDVLRPNKAAASRKP
jgi:hypothetical protein